MTASLSPLQALAADRCRECGNDPAAHEAWCSSEIQPVERRPLTHADFRSIEGELGLKLEAAGKVTDAARMRVEALQLQLEEATRELVRVEAIEAAVTRELDACWEARADFEALELERAHDESARVLEGAAVTLALLDEDRRTLAEDD